MKNLILATTGEKSLHKNWISDEYDIFLINYSKKNYSKDCNYYVDNVSGSKYNLIYKQKKEILKIINNYENIFIPDDDILIFPEQIKKIFEVHSNYKLSLSMPALRGVFKKNDKRYIEVPIMNSSPNLILKYTNWVGIICPCFSKNFFIKSLETFSYNKSNWGIALLWSNSIKEKDKIAIIDSIEAIHSRRLNLGESINQTYKKRENEFKEIKKTLTYKWSFKIIKKIYKSIFFLFFLILEYQQSLN